MMFNVFKRQDGDIQKSVMLSAIEEAVRRGDRRVGTDHLLLGLMHQLDPVILQALEVDLATIRAASAALDRTALLAIGIDVGEREFPSPPNRIHRLRPLTSGAVAVIKRSREESIFESSPSVEARHFLTALLARERPDPVAELFSYLNIDAVLVRRRLAQAAS